ncbi:MAG: class I SAM-dependent methyltransferase, partial [Novibacillus thermophilus]
MFTLADFQKTIDEQLSHNRNKSLFYMSDNGNVILSPSTKTIKVLKQDPEGIGGFIHSTIRDGTFQQLLREVSTKTIWAHCLG